MVIRGRFNGAWEITVNIIREYIMNTQRIILIIAIASAFSVGGCTGVINNCIDEKYVLDKQSGNGVIIFSTTSTGFGVPDGHVGYRPVGENKDLISYCKKKLDAGDRVQWYRDSMLDTGEGGSTQWDPCNNFYGGITLDRFLRPSRDGVFYVGPKERLTRETSSVEFASVSREAAAKLEEAWLLASVSREEVDAKITISMDKQVRGNLHTIELPAGTYEFYTCVGFLTPKFSWKFSVAPGEAKYIGNIDFRLRYSTEILRKSDVFKSDVYNKYLIGVTDMRQRDLALFEKKYPNIPVSDIVIDILKTE
jgi:hypothetical protein